MRPAGYPAEQSPTVGAIGLDEQSNFTHGPVGQVAKGAVCGENANLICRCFSTHRIYRRLAAYPPDCITASQFQGIFRGFLAVPMELSCIMQPSTCTLGLDGSCENRGRSRIAGRWPAFAGQEFGVTISGAFRNWVGGNDRYEIPFFRHSTRIQICGLTKRGDAGRWAGVAGWFLISLLG